MRSRATDWPPVLAVRSAFQVMVGAGSAMALAALAVIAFTVRRRRLSRRAALAAGVRRCWARSGSSPGGRLAGHRVGAPAVDRARADAHGGGGHRRSRYKAAPFWLFTMVYIFLAVAVVYLLAKQILAADKPPEARDRSRLRRTTGGDGA